MGADLSPDVAVSTHPVEESAPKRMHLQLEVNVYSGGEVRFEHRPIGADGVPLPSCQGEAQWLTTEPLTAALHLSHQIRSAIECLQRQYPIVWQ